MKIINCVIHENTFIEHFRFHCRVFLYRPTQKLIKILTGKI